MPRMPRCRLSPRSRSRWWSDRSSPGLRASTFSCSACARRSASQARCAPAASARMRCGAWRGNQVPSTRLVPSGDRSDMAALRTIAGLPGRRSSWPTLRGVSRGNGHREFLRGFRACRRHVDTAWASRIRSGRCPGGPIVRERCGATASAPCRLPACRRSPNRARCRARAPKSADAPP